MKRVALIAVAATTLATGAWAQSPSQSAIDTAVLAAPANMKDAVMVIKWKPDYTYDVLRPASNNNKLVCFDKSGLPGQQPFSIECTSQANLPRVAQNLKFEAEPDRAKRTAAIAAADKAGTRVKAEYGSVWLHLMGPSKEMARPHKTIALPGATAASTGLPDNGNAGGAWVMQAGTSEAHLMVPGD
jgi:hypothetical protein